MASEQSFAITVTSRDQETSDEKVCLQVMGTFRRRPVHENDLRALERVAESVRHDLRDPVHTVRFIIALPAGLELTAEEAEMVNSALHRGLTKNNRNAWSRLDH